MQPALQCVSYTNEAAIHKIPVLWIALVDNGNVIQAVIVIRMAGHLHRFR